MKFIKSTLLTAVLFLLLPLVAKAQLVVTPGSDFTPEQLIQQLVGEGVSVSNIQIQCDGQAYGVFNGENTTLPISSGIVLTSGAAINAIGPNNSGSQTGTFPFFGTPDPNLDPDLNTLATAELNDACIIQFDFIPFSDELSFNYVFGSEEYLEFAESTFNDVFAFFVTGPNPAGGTYNAVNIALVPGTDIPVSINTIHDAYEPNGVEAENEEYYINNGDGFEVDPESTIQYDGLTTTLAAYTNVVPCQTYTLKIAIADAGDSAFDSGVFLEAGSLSTNFIEVSANAIAIAGNANTAVEGCINASITFTATNPVAEDLPINFTISGTATAGSDYLAIPLSTLIPAGSNTVSIPVNVLPDDLTEGIETLVVNFTLDVACEQFDQTATLQIDDLNPLSITTPSTTIDPGQLVQLNAIGGSGTYSWSPSTGLGNPNIANPVATPTETTTYTVTSVVGACVLTDQVTITVQACDPATQVIAGSTTLSTDLVCAGSDVTATASDATLFEGDVVGFAIHAAPAAPGTVPANILALTTGTFTNTGYAYNTPYYITPIAADNNGAGLPDLDDPCLAVGTAATVIFLSPITFLINEECDWLLTSDYTVLAAPTGGYPAYNPNALYSLSGDANEQVPLGGSVALIFPSDQTPNVYSFTATDEQSCSGNISNSFPLCIKTPIELLSFTGEVQANGNLLKWVTATETNNDYFTIAHSTDGINFTNIGTQKGAGSSTQPLDYQLLDAQAPAGQSYYRLSQTDFDGTTTHSGNLALSRAELAQGGFGIVQLFPVPVKASLNVSVNVVKTGSATINVYDMAGKLALTQRFETNNVGNNTLSLSTEALANGMYLLSITNGTDVANTTFVKQ